jgi:hypothetical protein
VEDVIQANAATLFRGMEVVSVDAFRVTRNADVARDDDEAEDLLSMISEELRERRFAPAVRLEVDRHMPLEVRGLLVRELEVQPEEVYESDGLIDLADCAQLADLDLPALRYEAWEPVVPEPFRHEGETEEEKNIFAVIRRGDVLVHHPYESFTSSVLRLLDESADDSHVVAIKQTLYRTGVDSPVVRALLHAAERGKQVAVLIEVTARFDEQNNIQLAEILETRGCTSPTGWWGSRRTARCFSWCATREAAAHLLPRGDGKLPRPHLAAVQRPGGADLQPRDRQRPGEPLPLPHRVRAGPAVRPPGGGPARHAAHVRGAHRARDPLPAGARLGAHHRQDERAGRRGIIQELYRASQAGCASTDRAGHTRLRPGLPATARTSAS